MHLSSILIILPILFSYILAQQIPNCQTRIFQCDADWQTRTDPNTGDVYGYKAFIQNKMNFYEADVFCRARCAEVVSIHSQEEQDFVRRITAPVLNRCQFTSACTPVVQSTDPSFNRQLRSFWIGLNRVTGTLKDAHSVDNSVYQLWSDRTEVGFGSFPNNSVNSNTNSPPWTRGNPSGVKSDDRQVIEDCTQMVESRQGGWNDFPCNWRISGVICKRKCTSYCAAQDV